MECRACKRDHSKKLQLDYKFFYCNTCTQKWPEHCFVEDALLEWQMLEQLHLVECARCVLRATGKHDAEVVKCQKCSLPKSISDYGPVLCKEMLAGHPRKSRWRCYECQYPACKECARRPDFPPPHPSFEVDGYMCTACRYPPCDNCKKTERPHLAKYHMKVWPAWTCKTCRAEGGAVCEHHDEEMAGADAQMETSSGGKAYALEASADLVECITCKDSLPQRSFDTSFMQKPRTRWRCEGCRYPTCCECSTQRPKTAPPAKPKTSQDKRTYRCDACTYPACSSCGKTSRPCKNEAYNVDHLPFWFCDKVKYPFRHAPRADALYGKQPLLVAVALVYPLGRTLGLRPLDSKRCCGGPLDSTRFFAVRK